MTREGLQNKVLGEAAGLSPKQVPGLQLILEMTWDEAQRHVLAPLESFPVEESCPDDALAVYEERLSDGWAPLGVRDNPEARRWWKIGGEWQRRAFRAENAIVRARKAAAPPPPPSKADSAASPGNEETRR